MANGNTNFGNDQGTGTVGADGFLGPLTGDVTGNVTGNVIGNGTLTDLSFTGYLSTPPQILAAAGATQGTAGAITRSVVVVTVTASTQGVKLPTAVTGRRVRVSVGGTVGVKVYPFASDKISTASTNVAVLLAADKTNEYLAKDSVTWLVFKGA